MYKKDQIYLLELSKKKLQIKLKPNLEILKKIKVKIQLKPNMEVIKKIKVKIQLNSNLEVIKTIQYEHVLINLINYQLILQKNKLNFINKIISMSKFQRIQKITEKLNKINICCEGEKQTRIEKTE